jgi:predicted GH43/DUF377 family glycosyl hydrolase
MRPLALATLTVMLAGCGRYGDFALPFPQDAPTAVEWEWRPRPAPVLARGANQHFDSSDALNPSVVFHAGKFLNFYSGFDGQTWRTGLAESADGLCWIKRGPVLSPEGWEGSYIAANGHTLWHGGEFLMWYQAGNPPCIAFARSGDGMVFRKHGAPVLHAGPRGSWDERGVADPYVIRIGDWFYMFYLGQDRARRQRIGLARSQDGVHWTKLRSNPVLELGGAGDFDEVGLGEPAVWPQYGYYWMLYTGRGKGEIRRMGLAKSRDGVHWEKLRSPVIEGTEAWNAKVVCDGAVIAGDGQVRVWYGGGNVARPDERLNGQIGYGELRARGAKLAKE